MTTFALNNLWNYIEGLSLKQKDREWLASMCVCSRRLCERSAPGEAERSCMCVCVCVFETAV